MDDNQKAMVDEARVKLLEHFDSVQIFVTDHDGGKSRVHAYDSGGGNYYARIGHIREWMITQEQYTRTYADVVQRRTIAEDNNEE